MEANISTGEVKDSIVTTITKVTDYARTALLTGNLAHLGAQRVSQSTTWINEADFILTAFKEIFKRCEESTKEEITTINESKSMNRKLQSIKDNGSNAIEAVKILDYVTAKIEKHEGFCKSFKTVLDGVQSVIHCLISKGTKKYSLENQKEIYFNVKIISGAIKFHIDRLNLIKWIYEEFRNDFIEMDFWKVSSHLSVIAADILVRLGLLITTMSIFIGNLADYDSLISIISDNLGKKVNLPSVISEDKTFMIIKLDEVVQGIFKSSIKEINIAKVAESMAAEIRSIKKEGTYEKKIVTFLNDYEGKVKMYENFCHDLKAFLNETEVVMILISKKINQFSLDNKKRIYFILLIIREEIRNQAKSTSTVASKLKEFCADFTATGYPASCILKFTASANSSHVDIMAKVLARKTTFIDKMNIFIGHLLEYDSIFPEILSCVDNSLCSLSLTKGDKADVFIKKLEDVIEGFEESSKWVIESRKVIQSLNAELLSIDDGGICKKEFVNFLNNVEGKVKMQEILCLDIKSFLNEVGLVKCLLVSEPPDQFSLENVKKIYFYLCTLNEAVCFQADTFEVIILHWEKFRDSLFATQLDSNFSSHVIAADIFERVETIISSMNSFLTNLSEYEMLLPIILGVLEKKGESLNLPDEDKATFIITKLKAIVKDFRKSAIKKIYSRKVSEWIKAELQSVKVGGTCEPRIIKSLNDIKGKIKTNGDFCMELESFSNKMDSILNCLIYAKIDEFSFDDQEQIYSNLRIIHEGIQTQIYRLYLVKSNLEKLCNLFHKAVSSSNPSHFDIMADIPERISFSEINNCIEILTRNISLISIILNILRKKFASLSLDIQNKNELIITELDSIANKLWDFSKTVINPKNVTESIISELKSVNVKEMSETEMIKFLSKIEGKIQMCKEFHGKFNSILDEVESLMNNWIFGNIYQFSLENQKQVYFNLQIILERIRFHVARLNSMKSNVEKFRNNFCKMIFLPNSCINDALGRQKMFIAALNVFIGSLSDEDSFATNILNGLERNVASRLIAIEDNSDIDIEKLEKIASQFKEVKSMEIAIIEANELMIDKLQVKSNKKKKIIKILNFIEDKVKMHEAFSYEIKAVVDDIESIIKTVGK
ncbi:hypothetical protein HNY73_000722 [Argiope bruennichi]|uniref:Uncharacterized protein n=1 Tax=Argiope bruennichi TaxID=94029 RepID=A0A8T0G1K7_ARGBR|nr:hypothetical protein HNY73_000722 [Argiope bruennichi]